MIDHSDRAGWRRSTIARQTGTEIGVYHAADAGIDDDPTAPWATVCETHSTVVLHRTRRLADGHAADPCGWCQYCRAAVDGSPLCADDGEPMDRRGDEWVCPQCYARTPAGATR
ncbi:hypothetical protein [Pseudonocardia sp. D17]|uniref:hypothetical protein n=1 Tax=Pseudonocardia sp. D17 TaxID=882661 RepID=UPI002B36C4F2|nr:hypothetical protein PSD17_56770 [Pseudonocardia sp. D17]